MAVTATFSQSLGLLSLFGDGLDNTITVGRNAAGTILANGGAVAIQGGTPTVANTGVIEAFGQAGNDIITLDETNGALPNAELFGGTGNDTITGGSGSDELRGEDGNDILLGKGGSDLLFGGNDNDTLTGGDGDDQMFGEGGDDRFIWNPGDDTDLVEGGDGTDTVEVNGGNGDEVFTLTANGTRVRIDRVDPSPFSIDAGTTEKVVFNMNGGNDTFSATGNLAALTSVTVDGGAGNDTILGSNGNDVLLGGDGNDFVDGQQGNDVALLGAGEDVFQWDPGDGNDTVEGQDGVDTLLFNGSATNEIIEISANGERTLFTRNVANIVMDLNDVETIDVNALGGADTITVNDLSGTDVDRVNIDLAGTLGGSAGDAQADVVVINGTNGDDIITLALVDGDLVVSGLATDVVIENFEAANDSVRIVGLAGNDVVDASALGAGGPMIVIDGGDGDDVVLGGAGDDVLIGGAGDDIVIGNGGNDLIDAGAGENLEFQDNAGAAPTSNILSLFGDDNATTLTVSRDAAGNILSNGAAIPGGPTVANTALIRVFGKAGDDTITLSETNGALPAAALYGGAGNDTATGGSGGDMLFGEAGNDTLLGKGGFDFLFGGAGNDTLTGGDADDIMFGGAGNDRFIWNPGDDTDLAEGGSGTDTVEVNGGNGDEVFTVTANGTRVRIDRLDPAPFSIDVGTSESVVFNMNGGNDSFSATGNLAALTSVTVDGGAGNDTILGSNGNDLLLGGDGNDFIDGQQGNDTAFLGAGDDVFQWDPGDGNDIIEGQDGTDTMLFNGSGASEKIAISANGERGRFTRDVANITMDLNDVETIEFNALGGTDTITIGELSGTDVTEIEINLSGVLGGTSGDSAIDTVIVNGTGGNDVIDVLAAVGSAAVIGLPALVEIQGMEFNDRLTIQGGAGDDIISAATMPANTSILTLDGGAGNDTLSGGAGLDFLFGGDGNDVVDGNQGIDNAFLGAGNDVFKWDPGDGSDFVDGEAGADTLLFNGSGSDETFEISNDDGFGRLFRDVGAIVMLTDEVETFEINALGGADDITLNDVGIGLEKVIVDLAGTLGGSAGDAQVDTVTINDVNGGDQFVVGLAGGVVTVNGGAAQMVIEHAEITDRLIINGLAGNDVIDAGALKATSIALQVDGGEGDDTISGGAAADVLLGGAGSDILKGGAGADTLDGGANGDFADYRDKVNSVVVTLNGATNATVTVGGVAEDTIRNIENVFGGTAGDILTGDGFGNFLFGNSGNDLLKGGGGADTLDGGAGVDRADYSDKVNSVVVTLNGATNATVTVGGVAEDTIRNIENLVGGSAGDSLTGDGFANTFRGGGGADLLDGAAGSDTADYAEKTTSVAVTLNGSTNATVTVGGVAEDTIRNFENVIGGSAGDTLTGDGLANLLSGGGGNDTLKGGLGADTLDGGAGGDFADYRDKANSVVVTLNGVSDATVKVGGVAEDTVRNIENVQGGSAGDILTGDGFANVLVGNAGNDLLKGGGGADTLDGSSGVDIADYRDKVDSVVVTLNGETNATVTVGGVAEDTIRNVENVFGGSAADVLTGDGLGNLLSGGGGNDFLAGAAGADTFVFNAALGAATNVDHIADFATEDTIQLENAVFTELTATGTLAAGAFHSAAGATSAHDLDDRIVYDTTTGALYYDADGVGGVAAVQFADLDNNAALTSADFFVV